MPSVLVTGGAGYIGSHTCKALAAAGYTPVTFDNLVNGHEWAVKWGPLERGDIADRARLDAIVSKYRPIACMHFAAYAYVGESVVDPGKYYRNNLAGALSLLEALRDHQVGPFVFSSSCATYGIPDRTPISETAPQSPINPYGRTKLALEWMIKDFEAAHGQKFALLRYFNAAGADADGDIGEAHEPETHLIPLAIQAVSDPSSPLQVFGDDYPTPDGTCIRDYIHVTDLAEAHVLALKDLLAGGDSMALNLGTGRGQSVRAVIEAVEALAGQSVPQIQKPRRPGDPAELIADPSLAESRLGFQPHYRDIRDIVKTAWDWHGSQNQGKATE